MNEANRMYSFLSQNDSIGLAEIDESDADFFLEHLNDVRIHQFLSYRPPLTHAEETRWIKKVRASESDRVFLLVALDTETPKKIGVMGLHKIDFVNKKAASGAWIIPEFWNRGYGQQAKIMLLNFAFYTLGLETLQSSAIATNERSIAYNKSCGYQEAGRFQKAIMDHKGILQDEILLEILREKWKPPHKK